MRVDAELTRPAGLRAPRFAASKRLRIVQVSAVLLAGLLVRLAFVQSAGYHDDMVIFYGWFRSIQSLPPGDIYARVPGLNYPPLYVVLIEVSAAFLRLFVHGPPSDAVLNVMFKLPPILFDLGGAALAYRIVYRAAGHWFALLATAFIALNPAIIYDSAYWGQNDSIPAVLALLALAALSSGNQLAAWLSLACAVLFKPPVFVLVPLLLVYPFTLPRALQRRAVGWTCAGIVAALALCEALAVRFFSHPTPFAAFGALVHSIVAGSSYFAVNSLNAFNVWAVFEPFFVSDRTRVLFVSMHLFGDILFCAAAALICWRYLASRGAAGLFEAAVLLLLAFFLLLTEMHERYLYYAVVFLGVLVFKRPYRWAAFVVSLTLLFNLEYGLTFMYLDDAHATVINRFEFAPWLVHVCSLANIGVFLWLLADFLGLDDVPRAARRLLPRSIDELAPSSKRGPA